MKKSKLKIIKIGGNIIENEGQLDTFLKILQPLKVLKFWSMVAVNRLPSWRIN